MGKFGLYNIPLRGLSEGVHEFNYLLDDQFFKLIDDGDSDLRKGSVNVKLIVKRKSTMFEFDFELNGEVYVPCDRCLDDIAIEVETKNRLIVKFGKEYSEESDEIVIIPEDDGELNVAWFLFEFVSLTVPMKRVHPQGGCNRLMSSKLNKHRVTSDEDGEGSLDDDDDIQEESFSSLEDDSQWES